MKRLLLLINLLPIILSILYSIGTVFFSVRYFSVFYLIVLPLVNIIVDFIFIRRNKKSRLVIALFTINVVVFFFWLISSILICEQFVNGFDDMSFWMKLYAILELDKVINNY